ncbi:hypothetical protein CCACVL1_30903 [Corchorus capsularis]|uniref:Uncharacterized protein n=1 Tax=Corchorus capsularis TaxID=210143 RepID=A0A1R3FUT4_COCAP|nr:hypothetical protein CCACVL1_30903 [Corchorus capsularis]
MTTRRGGPAATVNSKIGNI